MNDGHQAMRKVFKVCKKTEQFIKVEEGEKAANKPVASDIIKAKKAMAYEEILEIAKKYAKSCK